MSEKKDIKEQKTKSDEEFAVSVFDHLIIKDSESRKIIFNKRG